MKNRNLSPMSSGAFGGRYFIHNATEQESDDAYFSCTSGDDCNRVNSCDGTSHRQTSEMTKGTCSKSEDGGCPLEQVTCINGASPDRVKRRSCTRQNSSIPGEKYLCQKDSKGLVSRYDVRNLEFMSADCYRNDVPYRQEEMDDEGSRDSRKNHKCSNLETETPYQPSCVVNSWGHFSQCVKNRYKYRRSDYSSESDEEQSVPQWPNKAEIMQPQKSHLPTCDLSTLTPVLKSKDAGKNEVIKSITSRTKDGIKPTVFKEKLATILRWFNEFNDIQKNTLISRLLKDCDLPQNHLLSVRVSSQLHKGCPPNCQDIITWLPATIATKIMSYLDPGNRRSEVGPICGTQSPGELTLSQNKFWVSMYGGTTEGGQRSSWYQGFTLSFTQVLSPVHESDGTSQSSGMEQGWYALIVIAGPLLCVIPLYFCLKRRHSVALYCTDQNSTEIVVQRFRKKHRPHPDLGRHRDFRIAISNPAIKAGEISNITAYSYHGGSGDYENVKGYRDDFTLFKNLYVRDSSFPSCDASLESPVFTEESQNVNKTDLPLSTRGNFLTVPCRKARNSRVSYLSILPDFESTLNNSSIQQSSQPLTVASIGKVNGKSVYIVQNQPTEKDRKPIIPTITITSASLRRKQRLSTVKNPEETNSKTELIDKSTGRPFRGSIKPNRHAKAWQSVEDIPNETDKCKEPIQNAPYVEDSQKSENSPNTCFEFSTPAISQYRQSIKKETKKSIEDAQSCLQTENIFPCENIIKVQEEPEPFKTELISESKRSEENQLSTQNPITSEMEIASEMEMLLQQQLNRPAQSGVDNTAFELSDAGKEFKGSSWNQFIKDGEQNNRSKVNDENMSCLNTYSNSG